ncbi:hypothetical protein GCM10022206_58850 [Streptomyces chiangmaiensis]
MHRPVQELRNKVRVARRELAQSPGNPEPSVAAHTALTEDEDAASMDALESFSNRPLDAELPAGDDGYSFADTLGAANASSDTVIDRESAKEGLPRLPERERVILYMRFFEDMTQSRIAVCLGISSMHVSRPISRSCARARRGDGTASGPPRSPGADLMSRTAMSRTDRGPREGRDGC